MTTAALLIGIVTAVPAQTVDCITFVGLHVEGQFELVLLLQLPQHYTQHCIGINALQSKHFSRIFTTNPMANLQCTWNSSLQQTYWDSRSTEIKSL